MSDKKGERSDTCTWTMVWTAEEARSLELSLLAGMASSLGAVFAVLKSPTEATLACLLGVAIGVMACLSFVELLVRNGMENGFVTIASVTTSGAATYLLLAPLVPDIRWMDEKEKHVEGDRVTDPTPEERALLRKSASTDLMGRRVLVANGRDKNARHSAEHLVRLGVLMAITMTLHNLPEGLAVAYSSFTKIGPTVAFAIAMHNIPEGIIVAAPVFAATGSRWKAVALATASGLSEPLGALASLLLIGSNITPRFLQHMMGFVGGVMLAVCGAELWPEGKRCRQDAYLFFGIFAGVVLMLTTLLYNT